MFRLKKTPVRVNYLTMKGMDVLHTAHLRLAGVNNVTPGNTFLDFKNKAVKGDGSGRQEKEINVAKKKLAKSKDGMDKQQEEMEEVRARSEATMITRYFHYSNSSLRSSEDAR